MYIIHIEKNREAVDIQEFDTLEDAITWAHGRCPDERAYITGGGSPSWPDYDYYSIPPEVEDATQWLDYREREDEEAREELRESYAAESRCHPEFW